MILRRLGAFAILSPLLFVSAPADAQVAADRQPRVALFIVSGMSFEEFMRVPQFRSLARAGGAALMSPRTVPGDHGDGAFLTLGTGARSKVSEEVRTTKLTARAFRLEPWEQIVDENRHRSVPGLLGSVLARHGLKACTADATTATMLFAANERGVVSAGVGGAFGRSPDGCTVTSYFPRGFSPRSAGRSVEQVVSSLPGGPVRVIVLEAQPSTEMQARSDEVTPIVMADGVPAKLFDRRGPMHTLTSDTTRLDGVVSNEDVAPTILAVFHIDVPSEMNGARISVVDAPPPFELHQRHLEQRRIRVPVDVLVGILALLFGLVGILVVWLKPRGVGAWAAVAPLSMPALAIAPLAAASLPSLTYGSVVPFIILVPIAIATLAVTIRNRGALLPAAAVGAAVLLFFMVEAARGWPDTLTTLFGGTALDGARFYGMPNVTIGIVMGAALWVCAVLPTAAGVGLLFAAGLFAGFPDLGVNFGAAITFFAAAGLWLAVRQRMGILRSLIVIVVLTLVGLGIVVGVNLLWTQAPTHGARFVENAPGRGVSGLLDFAKNRILVGWRLMIHAPLTWIPVLGLVPLLYLVLRPTPTLKSAFDRYPAWRDAVLVTILGSMVAYVANDSGPAAAGWGFGMAVAGIVYLPIVEETWRTATTSAR